MTRTGIIGLLATLALTCVAATASANTSLDDANRAFGEGRYADAVAAYQAIEEKDGYSAALLFDLGNAELRDGKPALAIVDYERARLLAPHDASIEQNLAIAREAAGVPDRRSMIDRVAATLTMDGWAKAALAASWIAALAFGLATLVRRKMPLVALGIAGLLATLTSAGGAAVASSALSEAIVLTPAPALVSPFPSAEASFSLSPGAVVELGAVRDGFVRIRDDGGRAGWVDRAQLEAVVPTADNS